MFKVGQKVWCAMFGEGVVTKILTNSTCYPVEVSFGGSVPEHYTLGGKFRSYANQVLFPYPVEIVKKITKPAINWEHVRDEYKFLAQDANGDACLYCDEPELGADYWLATSGGVSEAQSHVSFAPGDCDWKDSLVKRPEDDSHDDW